MGPFFTASSARKITSISQRQLDYWDERGLVRPSVRRAKGKGTERQYSFNDLVKLAVVKRLRESGISLQRIAKALKILRKRAGGDPLCDQRLITDGKSIHILTDEPSALEDVLKKGQLVFTVVAAGEIEARVTSAVRRLEVRAKAV